MENTQFPFPFYNHYLSSIASNAFKICKEVDDKTVALVYYYSDELSEDYAAGIINGHMGREFDAWSTTQLGIDEHQNYDIVPEGSNWRVIEKQTISQPQTTTQPMQFTSRKQIIDAINIRTNGWEFVGINPFSDKNLRNGRFVDVLEQIATEHDIDGVADFRDIWDELGETSCNKCNGTASPSTALHHAHNQPHGTGFKQDHLATSRVECHKCNECGHSWIPEKQTTPEQEEIANLAAQYDDCYIPDEADIIESEARRACGPIKKYYANRDSSGNPIYVGSTVELVGEMGEATAIGIVTLATPTVLIVQWTGYKGTSKYGRGLGGAFYEDGDDSEAYNIYKRNDSFLKGLFRFVKKGDYVYFEPKGNSLDVFYKIWCYVHGFEYNSDSIGNGVKIYETICKHRTAGFDQQFLITRNESEAEKILHEALTTVSRLYTKCIKQLAPIFREHTFGSPIDKFAEYCDKQGIEFVK